MKYCWLILIFAVSSSAIIDSSASFEEFFQKTGVSDAFNKTDTEVEAEIKEFVTETMGLLFENFTDFLQSNHPSVAVPIKNVTTCIKNDGRVEALKNLLIGAQMLLIKGSNFTERGHFCSNNTEDIFEITHCIELSRTPETEPFLSTLWNTAHFVLDEFCGSPEPFKFFTFAHDSVMDIPEFHKPMMKFNELVKNNTVPSEQHFCLPVRVAEGYEIAAIRTHSIPFGLHGLIAESYHFFATIIGNFPFKTVEECVI